jgi:acetyl esterase/lipase
MTLSKHPCILCIAVLLFASRLLGGEPLDIWPQLAPGETTRQAGEQLPGRPTDMPPITRVTNVTRPTMTVHLAAEPNGTGVIILPGGGFGRVVPDLEGTEAANWLNRHGVSAFVLSYRTTADSQSPGWVKPLQDAQRALALVRSRASEWKIRPDRLGLVGFSAGGQVAARLLCDGGKLTYDRQDAVDDTSHRPDFSILIYPWNMYDMKTDSLITGIEVPKNCPPTYLVHTDDDRSSSLGAVLFYAGLKRNGIPAELHVYGNGGHGYGLRPIAKSQISTWPDHAAHWLGTRGFLK